MAFQTKSVSVGTTPVRLDVADRDSTPTSSIAISNEGSTPIRVGGPDVTFTGAKRGLLVAAGAERSIDIASGSTVYAVAESGTVDVTVGQMGI